MISPSPMPTFQVVFKYHPTLPILVGSDGSIATENETDTPHPYCRAYYLLRLQENRDGYLYVQIERKNYFVHRLILETFLGPCPPDMECLHGDGNRQNNTLINLRWGSKQDNYADQVQHGTAAKGEKNGMATVTDKQREKVRELNRLRLSQRQIAKEVGISQATVSRILKK